MQEPPVFAKRSIFTIRATGEQDQWIQCDDCSKWRRLPLTVIIASKWTCADNSWDPKSCSCSAPEELTPKELQSVLQQYEGMIYLLLFDLDNGLLRCQGYAM
jgi:hypothetical protein